jgi:hypothetical protein
MKSVLLTFGLAVVALDPSSAHAQGRVPPEWTGIIEISAHPQQGIALLTADLVGGQFGDTPGTEPDGRIDWVFVLVRPTMKPPAFIGSAALRVPDGNATFLEFVELVPTTGGRTLFLQDVNAIPTSARPAQVVPVCRIVRAYSSRLAPSSHTETVKALLTQTWDPARLPGPPCDAK